MYSEEQTPRQLRDISMLVRNAILLKETWLDPCVVAILRFVIETGDKYDIDMCQSSILTSLRTGFPDFLQKVIGPIYSIYKICINI